MFQIQVFTPHPPFQPKAFFAACAITSALVAIAAIAIHWNRAQPIQNASTTPPKSPFFHYLFGIQFQSLEELRDHVKSNAYQPTENDTDVDQLIEQHHIFSDDGTQPIFEEIVFTALDKGACFHNQHVIRGIPNRDCFSDPTHVLDLEFSEVTMGSTLWLATGLGSSFCTQLIRHESFASDHTDITELLSAYCKKPLEDSDIILNMVDALLAKNISYSFDGMKDALIYAAKIDMKLFKRIHNALTDCPDNFIIDILPELEIEELSRFIDEYQETYDLTMFKQICNLCNHLPSCDLTWKLLSKTPEIRTRYDEFVDAAQHNGLLLQAVFEHGAGSSRDFQILENWVKNQEFTPYQYFADLSVLVGKKAKLTSPQIQQIIPRLQTHHTELIQMIKGKSDTDTLVKAVVKRLIETDRVDTDFVEHFTDLPLIQSCINQTEIDVSLIQILLECEVMTTGVLFGRLFDTISVEDWDETITLIRQLSNRGYPSRDDRYNIEMSLLDTSGAFTEVAPVALNNLKSYSRFTVLHYIDTLPMYDDLSAVCKLTRNIIEHLPSDLSLAEIIHMTKYKDPVLSHVLDAIPEDKPIASQFREIQAALNEERFPKLTSSYEDLKFVIPRLGEPTIQQIAAISDADVACALLDKFNDNTFADTTVLTSYLDLKTKHDGNRIKIVKKLIEKGAPIDQPNDDGASPLFFALLCFSKDSSDDAEIIAYLISEGADIEAIAECVQQDKELWNAFKGEIQYPEVIIPISFLKPHMDFASMPSDELGNLFRGKGLSEDQTTILAKIQPHLPRPAASTRKQMVVDLPMTQSFISLVTKIGKARKMGE